MPFGNGREVLHHELSGGDAQLLGSDADVGPALIVVRIAWRIPGIGHAPDEVLRNVAIARP